MPLSKQEWLALEKKALDLRKLTVQTTVWAGSGHFGGGMSVMDLLTVLYHKYLNIKVEDPQWEDRDRFILSKGHAAIAYAPVLCLVITFLPRSKRLLLSWLQSPTVVILEPRKIKSDTVSTVYK